MKREDELTTEQAEEGLSPPTTRRKSEGKSESTLRSHALALDILESIGGISSPHQHQDHLTQQPHSPPRHPPVSGEVHDYQSEPASPTQEEEEALRFLNETTVADEDYSHETEAVQQLQSPVSLANQPPDPSKKPSTDELNAICEEVSGISAMPPAIQTPQQPTVQQTIPTKREDVSRAPLMTTMNEKMDEDATVDPMLGLERSNPFRTVTAEQSRQPSSPLPSAAEYCSTGPQVQRRVRNAPRSPCNGAKGW